MKLLVSVAAETYWQVVASRFNATRIEHISALVDIDDELVVLAQRLNCIDIAQLLSEYSSIEFVVTYAQPEDVIATAVAQGLSFSEAVQLWKMETDALLLLQQQHRKQLQLLNLQHLLDPNASLPDWLATSWPTAGCQIPLLADYTVMKVLASQAISQQKSYKSLQQKLFVSSLPLCTHFEAVFDLDLIKRNLIEAAEFEKIQAELAQSQQQQTKLQQDVVIASQEQQKLTQQLEALQLTRQQESSIFQQQQAEAALQLDNIRTKAAQAEAALTETAAERELVFQQLLKLQEALEVQLLAAEQFQSDSQQQQLNLQTRHQQKVAELSQLIEQLQQEVLSVQQSSEHTVAQWQRKCADSEAQLVQITKQLTQQQEECVAIASERDLILQQLLSLQEAFEAQHHQTEQQKVMLEKQLSQQIQLSQQEHNKLRECMEQLQRELEQAVLAKTALAEQLPQFEQKLQQQQDYNRELENSKQLLQVELTEVLPAKFASLQQQLDQAKKQQSESEQENSVLLRQLLLVQEELESYVMQLQTEQQKYNHATTAKEKQYQRELNRLESKLRIVKAKAASAEHQVQLLRQELLTVKTSVVWKSAAPVRVLSRMVKKTDKAKQKLQQDTALLLTSEYFDLEWYLETYPDVAQSKMNPAEHYLRFGAAEGRMPGPLFDGNWYLQLYPDVAASNTNPLLHFIKFGQQEGRSTSPKLLTDHSQLKEE